MFAHVPAHGTIIAHSLGRALLCASEESSGYLYPPITHLLVLLNNLPFISVSISWVCSNTLYKQQVSSKILLKRYGTHECRPLPSRMAIVFSSSPQLVFVRI